MYVEWEKERSSEQQQQKSSNSIPQWSKRVYNNLWSNVLIWTECVENRYSSRFFYILYFELSKKKRRIMMVEKENFSLITNRNYPFGECVSFFGAAVSHSKLVSIYLCERLRFASS